MNSILKWFERSDFAVPLKILFFMMSVTISIFVMLHLFCFFMFGEICDFSKEFSGCPGVAKHAVSRNQPTAQVAVNV